MKKFDSAKWITENKHGKLLEKADPDKVDPQRFPQKLSAVDKEKATKYSDSGEFDGQKDDDVIPVNKGSYATTILKPSQSSMNIEKALAFAIHMMSKTSPFADGPGGDLDAFISVDNYIMDGHHRWIATAMVDPKANIEGHRVDFPGKELVAVLNTLTKGEFNKAGKSATGGFEQFQEAPIKAQLEKYLEAGVWSMKPEQVQSAIEEFTGVKGEGAKEAAVKKFVQNLSGMTLTVPGWASERPDMPVISAKAGHVKQAIDKLNTGDVDVNPPYGDDKMNEEEAKTLGDVEILMKNIDRINNQQELEQVLKKLMDHIAAGNVTGGSLALTNALGTGPASTIKKQFGIKESVDSRSSLYERIEKLIDKN